uniref:Uncharacterized protein n=1 Tax=mine drainage metagenome TaxID=410659 RepID=E6QIG2_9ZZZZ
MPAFVFAHPIRQIDHASGLQTHRLRLRGQLPSHGFHRRHPHACLGGRHLQPNVFFLHHADRGRQAHALRQQDRLGVAVSERFEFFHPSGEYWCDAFEGEFAVDAKRVLGDAPGQFYVGECLDASLHFIQVFRGHGESYGESVSAKAGEKIGAGFDGLEQRETVDGAPRAVGDAVLDAEDECWFGRAFNDARGEDADDAAVPAVASEDEDFFVLQRGVRGEPCVNGLKRGSFGGAALGVELFKFLSEGCGARLVACGEEFDNLGSNVHAPGGVDARAEAEAEVEAGELTGLGIERGGSEERFQANARRAMQFADSERGQDAIFAEQRHGVRYGGDGDHLEKGWKDFCSRAVWIAPLQQRLSELEGDSRAAQGFLRVSAFGLVGIEDGQRVRNGIAGLRQVVVGDDQVKAQRACRLSFGEGAHASVYSDHQRDALGCGGFEDGRLQAVALA